MAKPEIRLGVIGTGSMGKNHARIFGELPNVKFTAVFDQNTDTAREIASRYGAAAVASLDAFADAVDAATIATPTVTHFEIAKALLERGKHALDFGERRTDELLAAEAGVHGHHQHEIDVGQDFFEG